MQITINSNNKFKLFSVLLTIIIFLAGVQVYAATNAYAHPTKVSINLRRTQIVDPVLRFGQHDYVKNKLNLLEKIQKIKNQDNNFKEFLEKAQTMRSENMLNTNKQFEYDQLQEMTKSKQQVEKKIEPESVKLNFDLLYRQFIEKYKL